jgi:hypothetical protein
MKKKLILTMLILFQAFFLYAFDLSGIWENRLYQHFRKGTFSWGENVFSTGSVVIDLNCEKPYVSTHGGGTFFISDIEYVHDKILLTGIYNGETEDKKIIIGIVDDNTISIRLENKNIRWLMHPNDKNIFHRVPRDAPYEPLGPEGI